MTQPPDRKQVMFKVGELVLCRYASYPYWPAVIMDTFPPDVIQSHCCWMETKEGFFNFYWCHFCNETKGGWVREDRIVKYHPELAKRTMVPKNHSWYEDQRDALRAALKQFRTSYSPALQPRAQKATEDLMASYQRHLNGFDESDDDELLKLPKQNNGAHSSEPPTVSSEKSQEDIKDELGEEGKPPTRKSKRERAELTMSTVADDERYASTQTLSECYRVLSTLSGEGTSTRAVVNFFVPEPANGDEPERPDPMSFNSVDVDREELAKLISEVQLRGKLYTESVLNRKEQADIFGREQERLRCTFQTIYQRLRESQKTENDCKIRLINGLHDILQARVRIADLKILHAGTLIQQVQTDFESVPLIAKLCEDVINLWKKLVENYCYQNG